MNQSEMLSTENSMNHGIAHCVVRFMWIVLSVMTGASGGDAIGGDAERIESLDQLGVLNVLDPFAPESNITSTIGKRRILLRPGQLGLGYSQDEAIVLFSQRPLRGFIVAASDTYLISGPSLNSIRVARKVLSPGRPGSVDNGYAGIKGFYVEPRTKRLIAVYHAEDNEDLPKVKVNDVTGAYWRACLAISTNGGLSFKKHGPIISSRVPKRALGTTQNADNPVQPI
jgi:hypothetical protein